jgi:hypothetical protein
MNILLWEATALPSFHIVGLALTASLLSASTLKAGFNALLVNLAEIAEYWM